MEIITQSFKADDGTELTYDELGSGPPLVLLHGYMHTARLAWIDSGIGERLAASGRRIVMPDLRGHGRSNPRDPSAYPRDALTTDALGLIAHLDVKDYELGGYSLGARVVARALALGAMPRRAFIAGTGLDPILHAEGRGANYKRIFAGLGTFAPGSAAARTEQYLKQTGADPDALGRLFDTLVDTPAELLAQVEVPTLVIAGRDDTDRGSIEDLAALLRHGTAQRVPGNHYSAASAPELTDAILEFLDEPA